MSLKNKCLSSLLNSCGLQSSDETDIVLNYVLQHFWSSVVLNDSCDLDENSTLRDLSTSSAACSSSSSLQSVDGLENIEAKSIQEHAGFVCKRVRDLFKDRPAVHKIQVSKTKNVQVEVSKHFMLSLIQRFGHDTLIQPGRFLFIPILDVLDVFVYLHNIIEHLTQNMCRRRHIKNMFNFLSEDPNLRLLWQKLLGDEDDETFRAGSVMLLQRVVIMFLKSKQKIIREQLQLKDNQQSSSLRQIVGKSRKPKEEPIECVVAFGI